MTYSWHLTLLPYLNLILQLDQFFWGGRSIFRVRQDNLARLVKILSDTDNVSPLPMLQHYLELSLLAIVEDNIIPTRGPRDRSAVDTAAFIFQPYYSVRGLDSSSHPYNKSFVIVPIHSGL